MYKIRLNESDKYAVAYFDDVKTLEWFADKYNGRIVKVSIDRDKNATIIDNKPKTNYFEVRPEDYGNDFALYAQGERGRFDNEVTEKVNELMQHTPINWHKISEMLKDADYVANIIDRLTNYRVIVRRTPYYSIEGFVSHRPTTWGYDGELHSMAVVGVDFSTVTENLE